jgi:hypothetical protein
MRCQRCDQRKATVHISDHRILPAFAETRPPELISLCDICAAEFQREVLTDSRPPSSEGVLIEEQVRIISITPEWTVLRLVRTESERFPQEWRILTALLPQPFYPVGEQISIALTSSELELLKGNRQSSDI